MLAEIGGQWRGVSPAVAGGDSGRRVSVGGGWTVLGRKVWAAEQGTVLVFFADPELSFGDASPSGDY